MSDTTLTVGDGDRKFAHPNPCVTRAVCVDMYIKNDVSTRWGLKDQIHFRWEIDVPNPDYEDGRHFVVREFYTFVLTEKSNLYALVTSWTGKSPPKGALVDFEWFVGRSCMVQIVHGHNASDPEDPYINVRNVMPLMEGMQPLQPSGRYVRQNDRDALDRNGSANTGAADKAADEEAARKRYGGQEDTPAAPRPAPDAPAPAPAGHTTQVPAQGALYESDEPHTTAPAAALPPGTPITRDMGGTPLDTVVGAPSEDPGFRPNDDLPY